MGNINNNNEDSIEEGSIIDNNEHLYEEKEYDDGKTGLLDQETKVKIGIIDNEEEELTKDKENGANKFQKDKPKASLMDHKYKKDLILLNLLLLLLILSTLIYYMFIPTLFLNYVSINFPNLSVQDNQSKATFYKSFSDGLPYIMMFLFGPLAVLSDKFGRKVMIYYGIIIVMLDMLSCYVSIKTNNLVYYYIMHSLGGTANISLAAIFSYISDISHDDLVPILYTYTSISSGIATIVGPLIFVATSSKTASNEISFTTLYVAFAFIIATLITVPFLRESLEIAKENNKVKLTAKQSSNPFKLIKKIFTTNGYIAFVIILYASLSFTSKDVQSTYYYHNALLYGWGTNQNGYFTAFIGALTIIISATIIPFFLKRYSERKIITAGFLISFIAHVGYSFSEDQWLWIIISSFNTLADNTLNLLQSVVSRGTPTEAKGSILTGCRSIGSLTGFFGSFAANGIYKYFTSSSAPFIFAGAVYLFTSVIIFTTFLLSLYVWRKYKNPNPLVKPTKKKKSLNINDENSRE